MNHDGLRRCSGWLVALAAYVGLAVLVTWPLIDDVAGRIAVGTERTTTVAHASAWALWWVSDRIASLGHDFWNAPIFYPTLGSFALSEPMLLQGLLASPVLWLGGTPVLAHNLVLLASLVANGLATYGLMGQLRAAVATRLAVGAAVVVMPFVHDQLGVLTLVSLAGPIAALWAALAFAERPGPGRGLWWGGALAATYLSSAQLGLFTVLATVPTALTLRPPAPRRLRWLLGAAVGAAFAVTLVAPVAWQQLQARDALDLSRSSSLASRYAASPRDFALRSPAQRRSWGMARARGREHALFPGAVPMLVAGAAVGLAVAGRLRRRRRRALVTLLVFGTSAQLLSMAPHGPAWLFDGLRAIPGLAQVRSFWRAAALWQVAVFLMAGIGLEALRVELSRRRSRGVGYALVASVLLLTLVELHPRRQPLRASPVRHQHAALAAYLDTVVPDGEPIAFLPAPPGPSVRDYEEWAWWMAAQDQVRWPQVGGYSSYFPDRPYRPLLDALRRFPEGDWRQRLRVLGVRYVVVRATWWQGLANRPDDLVTWRPPHETHWVVQLGE